MNGERAADEGDHGDGPSGDRGIQQLTELGLGDVEAAGRAPGPARAADRAPATARAAP
jgi:hypothetical protein